MLAGATLLMVGLSWPLWLDRDDPPAVPFVLGFPEPEGAWSWAGLGAIALGLGLGMTRRLGRPGVALAAVAMAWLVVGDQLRFQPWVYQFLVLGTLLVVLPGPSAMALGRVWMAAMYLHSGLSKLDASFLREMGPLFARTFARVTGLSTGLERAAVLMPVVEIVVALMLLSRRTRAVGYVGVLAIHAALIVILGPWGLGHSAIVLVWNVALAVEEFFLFWPADAADCIGPPGTSMRWTARERLVAVPFAALLVLPLGERLGLFDSWPSHALYASHCEGSRIAIEGGLPRDLPDDLRIAAARSEDDGVWSLSPTDWTRRACGVPAYPQARYANGLAEWVAGRVGPGRDDRVVVVHRLRAGPGDVAHPTRTARGLREIRALAGRFWFNPHPKGRAER